MMQTFWNILGRGFGSKGEGYFRVSAFNSRANAEEVAKRLQELKW